MSLKICDGISWVTKESAQRYDSCAREKDCSGGRDFSFGPDGPVAEEFLLPDGHVALERVDAKSAGIECGPPMCGADSYQHGGFPDFQPPKAVNHGKPPDGE